MSSRYRYAEFIIATSTAMETKSPGGKDERSIPSQHRGCSGFRPGVSDPICNTQMLDIYL
jgi:hypothetical protein